MQISAAKPDLNIEPLPRDTLQERVYRQVAGLILDGGIAPGQLVTIQGLAEAFGVSAMPVREALKRLTAANALTVVSGRSIGVPPLNLERLTDLRNVRHEIEGTASSWAALRADKAAIARLEKELERMQQAIASGDTKGYLQANRAFHFAVYQSAGSPTLFSFIEVLWLQIGPYLNLLRESGNYVSSNLHHRGVLDAIVDRNPEAARAALSRDIEDAYQVLVEVLG